jgi:hypothetical protein
MTVLSLENLDVSNYRELVFLVDQGVSCTAEHNIGDQASLFVSSRVLSDWDSNCEMAVREVRSHSLVSEDHVEPNDSILRVFGALKKHIHVNVLDDIELFLRRDDFVFVNFLNHLLGDGCLSRGTLGLRIDLSFGVCLGWSSFLCLLLLGSSLVFVSTALLVRSSKFLKLDSEVGGIKVLWQFFESVRNV